MFKKFSDEIGAINESITKSRLGGSGNDPDSDGETVESKKTVSIPTEQFIVGNVDSKTQGYEKYADCFAAQFGMAANEIKLNTLNRKVYRI